jgi:3-phenylpropionate/trans-cinnamate dioxygenase ferredoxin reductase subunit
VPGVYAVGDCASFWSARYKRRIRTEHWDGALRAPATLAGTLTGDAVRYDPVPYFWSEQFGRMLQYAGHHASGDELVLRGDPAGPKWSVCWLSGGCLAAILTVDLPKDLMQGRRLIESGAAVDSQRLADPAVQVRQAAV